MRLDRQHRCISGAGELQLYSIPQWLALRLRSRSASCRSRTRSSAARSRASRGCATGPRRARSLPRSRPRHAESADAHTDARTCLDGCSLRRAVHFVLSAHVCLFPCVTAFGRCRRASRSQKRPSPSPSPGSNSSATLRKSGSSCARGELTEFRGELV